ncbi:MAG: hypothetical protein ABI318_14535 [Chthoniobacteraceae bacterium]
MTQLIQPNLRRKPGGIRAHIAAGIIFALLFVVLVNVRPFSPWLPPGATLNFAAEIVSPGDGTVQVGRMIFGGVRLLPSGRVQVAKSEAPRTVLMKVHAEDSSALLFQTSVGTGTMELRNPRIQDDGGRVLHRFQVAQAKPMADGIAGSAANGVLRLRLVPGTAVSFETEKPIELAGPLWPGLGTVLAEFFVAAVLFGGLCALMARRFAGVGARFAAAVNAWVESKPKTALFCAALAGVLVSCHPVIFLGRSFVSPNNGARALYDGFPSLPGDKSLVVKDTAGSDLGAMMWAFLPYSCMQHEALAHGEWPLRNRYAGCGLGLQGQGISMFGDPLHLIPVAANGAAWAWDLKFILARLLFAWGLGLVAFAAVRRMNVALLLALSASFIGHFAYRFNHAAHFSMCYAPWVLLPWVQAARCTSFRAALKWMPLAVIAQLALFNSGALKEAVIMLGVLNGAGLLALLLRPLPWRERLAPVAAMLVANGIFVLVAAPFWLTFLDLLGSARTIYDKSEVYQIQPSLLVGLFDDLFYRQLSNKEEHFDPSGNFLLLLGVLWSLVRARSLVREPLWLASAIAAAGALAVVFGVVPPSWISAMPFLGKIWHVDNCFSVAAIALTFVLAAFGLRDCLDRRNEPSWRGDWVMFCIGVGALFALYFGFTHAAHRSGLSLLAVGTTVPKSPFFTGYATALAVSVLVLPLLWRRNARTGLGAGGWLAVGVALSLIHFRHANYAETKFDAYVMSPQPRPDIHAKSSAVESIRRSLADSRSPARVVGFGGNLSVDFNAVYGLESPFSCDAVSNRWQWELAAAAGIQRVWEWRALVIRPQFPALLPALDMLGVRFYVGTPIANAPAIPGLVSLGRADLAVHESRTAWPRAFFTDRVARYTQPRDLMELVNHANSVPLAAVERGAPLPAALESDAERLAGRAVVAATDYRLTPNTTAFHVNASAPGIVVLGEAFEQGNYAVTVNGAKAEPLRVNHAFLGVLVDSAGPCEIMFTYRPRLWRLSLCIAAAGLVLAIGVWLWALRRRAALTSPW